MYTILLAGGFGTRLFPLSRRSFPKQFIPLLGDTSLFQKAVQRALLFSKPDEIYVVTNKDHKFLVADQLLGVNAAGAHVLLEPVGKNTLPAIYYATSEIAKKDADAIILVLSSDQLLEASAAYHNAVFAAKQLVADHIVTFGVLPTCPHTGYGYIKPGAVVNCGFVVDTFKEKPTLETAKEYVASGYLWNAGIFCFSASVFFQECACYAPDVVRAFSLRAGNSTISDLKKSATDVAFSEEDITSIYASVPQISIDYGLLEKSSKVAVVPLDLFWDDLGNFSALYDIHEKDGNGNAVDGEYFSPDGKNNLIISSNKLVSTIGLSDIAVIDTPDVLLVAPKNMTQKIGTITELLNERGDERVILHTTVHRPWGAYTCLLRGKTYLIKKIHLHPHKKISLQYHNHRSEHWVVINGEATVTNGDKVITLSAGNSTFIPQGQVHRLANEGDGVLEVIEVQMGEIISEEDIVRVEDTWKRA